MKSTGSILAVASLFATLLLGSPLRDWIDRVSNGSTVAAIVIWAGVLICVAAAVWIASATLRSIERRIIRRRMLALDDLAQYAVICRQDGRQLQDEAADEQNDEVDFQHYCEMARMLSENLNLLWRGSDASALFRQDGANLGGIEALIDALDRHYHVEIDGPLGSRPGSVSEKKNRIREAGFGGRCVSLLCSQLLRVISRIRADSGAEPAEAYNDTSAA